MIERDGIITLSVEDNGIGLPDDFDIKKESSLGMTLVSTLTKQLGGDLEVISNEERNCFQIKFEIEE